MNGTARAVREGDVFRAGAQAKNGAVYWLVTKRSSKMCSLLGLNIERQVCTTSYRKVRDIADLSKIGKLAGGQVRIRVPATSQGSLAL